MRSRSLLLRSSSLVLASGATLTAVLIFMPLTLTLTEGAIPVGQEKELFRRLSEAMLRWTGLEGNSFMTAAVIGSIHLLPRERTLAGLKESSVVFVEWKVPSIAFVDRDVQIGYIREATEIVHASSGGNILKSQIWVNVVHAVDGAWGIEGEAMTNDQLTEAITQAARK